MSVTTITYCMWPSTSSGNLEAQCDDTGSGLVEQIFSDGNYVGVQCTYSIIFFCLVFSCDLILFASVDPLAINPKFFSAATVSTLYICCTLTCWSHVHVNNPHAQFITMRRLING